MHSLAKKYLRTNSRHLRIEAGAYTMVIERDFLRDGEPARIFESLLREAPSPLTAGEPRRWRTTVDRREVIITEYPRPPLWRQFFARSPACRSWLAAHRLVIARAATERPLAFVEGKLGRSWLVTE